MGVFVKQANGWLNLETGAPPAVDPTKAAITSDPVTVSALVDPVSYTVKLNDGSSKKLWVLQGNTGSATTLHLTDEAKEKISQKVKTVGESPIIMAPYPQEQATYQVGLGAGVLYGVMVASGGSGGSATNTSGYGGAGGAGGVIGFGAKITVPIIEAGTFTFTVGSTTPQQVSSFNTQYEILNGQPTFMTDASGNVIASAVGGGHGGFYFNDYMTPGQGGSGGGSIDYGGPSGPDTWPFQRNGRGTPGQGQDGALWTTGGGAGGGYSQPGNELQGGDGFDLATAFDLDVTDSNVQAFLNLYTDDGWIAGGGGGFQTSGDSSGMPGGKGGGGYGWTSGDGVESGRNGKDFTGSGGGGTYNTTGPAGGGAGAVYLLGDV